MPFLLDTACFRIPIRESGTLRFLQWRGAWNFEFKVNRIWSGCYDYSTSKANEYFTSLKKQTNKKAILFFFWPRRRRRLLRHYMAERCRLSSHVACWDGIQKGRWRCAAVLRAALCSTIRQSRASKFVPAVAALYGWPTNVSSSCPSRTLLAAAVGLAFIGQYWTISLKKPVKTVVDYLNAIQLYTFGLCVFMKNESEEYCLLFPKKERKEKETSLLYITVPD